MNKSDVLGIVSWREIVVCYYQYQKHESALKVFLNCGHHQGFLIGFVFFLTEFSVGKFIALIVLHLPKT